MIGDLPWGSHVCQFYQTREDLLEILVPYWQAGLRNNEFCLWIVDGPLEVEEANRALKKAMPRFERYTQQGQMEVISRDQWHDGELGSAVVSRLDQAISRGFDGLRLACHAFPDGVAGPSARDAADALCQYNVIAVFAYPRDKFEAVGLMAVVKNHRLALVKNAGRWEVIESSEAQSVKEALRRSEEKLHSVFANMSEGYAYHRIVLDGAGNPCDYVFLEVNETFERLTGLKREGLLGRRATQALPGLEKDPADWIGTYGRVALSGKPAQFESYSQSLRKWYSVSAFSPHKGFFAVTFSDITERKATEKAMRGANARLQNQAEELQTQAEELHAQAEELRAANDELLKNEEALRISEQRVRLKLDSILLPGGDLGNLELADIIDTQAIQSLMDDFHALARIPMAIIDLKGRVLVGVGWQEICTRFHRVHAETCRYCIESDTQLTVGVAPGESRLYKCKNHMWDIATPLMVAGHHVGNLFSGQFFFDDELLERELFRAQAQRYGFDEQQYLAALDAVPRLSREAVDTGMAFLMKLARMISQLSYGNIQLARSQEQLLKLNRTLEALSNSSQALTRATEEEAYLQEVCRIVVEDCGHAMVWIGYAEEDEAKSVRPVAHAGFEEGYLETLQITWADTERGRGPTGTAIRTGRPCLCRNMLTDPNFAPWREQALQRGYASSIVLPLLTEGRTFGAITIYSREPDPFAPDEVQLLMELAADLAHGITMLRLRAARAQAEESLRESEARLRLAQDAAHAGTWEWNLRTNQNYWSEELWRLYGLEPYSCEPSYDAWRQTIHPEDLLRVEQSVQEAARQETVLNAEWRVRERGGQERWLMSRGQPVRDAQGRTTSYRGIVLDITDRKRAEEALRESEQRLRLALEGGRMGRWEWDVRSDSTFWDERVHELLGLEPLVPASSGVFFRIVDRRDRDTVRRLVDQALARGEDYLAEFRVNHANGETPWLVSQGRVIRDEQGQAVRMIGVMYDVTQHKQMEADLRRLNDQLEEEVQAQTEELRDTVDRLQDEVARRVLAEGQLRKRSQMLEAFFQHTITPLAFLDKAFNFVRVNAAYAEADAKDPQYFIGKNHFALYPHDENRALFEQVVQTRQPYFAYAKPFAYPDAPQRVRYWDWRLTPLLDERGEVQFLVLNLEDVTKQQTAFQELEQRARQLQKLTLELSQAEDRERKRLAQILHDDLQQQLAAAKFHLSLLGHRIPNDAASRQAVAQLDQILKDAIEKSRSLSHELSPAVLYHGDLGETFEWLARQLKAKHGLTVHVESRGHIDPASEPLKVFLFRTAREILFNVIKHARVQEARLRVQRMRGGIWLTISDQGQGFEARALGKAEGFGLLSIRERIELLGGRLKIRSAPGRGSTFLIAVPDAQPPEDRRPTTEDRQPKATPSSVLRPPSSVLRVLLVDDHKVMREGLATLLNEQADLEVVGQAGNGREAIDLADRLRPDVVVMDAAMPVMAGTEATRQIKLQWPEVRVVALSMFEETDMSEAMRGAGAEAYLLKTAPSDELLAAIRGRPAHG